MVHPSDFHRISTETDSGEITYWVFPEPLEKGVIRRARFRMEVVEREQDEVSAHSTFEAARYEQPPLAT